MNPEQQAEQTREWLKHRTRSPLFLDLCHERTVGADGSKYYDPEADKMLFETMPILKLYRYTEEEILDIPNYAWMLKARGENDALCGALVRLAEELWYLLRSEQELLDKDES